MFDRILNRQINAEIIAALIFAVASGIYLLIQNGPSKLIDSLFLWMFPASVMIFLTLILVKIIERTSEKRVSRYHYVDLRKK